MLSKYRRIFGHLNTITAQVPLLNQCQKSCRTHASNKKCYSKVCMGIYTLLISSRAACLLMKDKWRQLIYGCDSRFTWKCVFFFPAVRSDKLLCGTVTRISSWCLYCSGTGYIYSYKATLWGGNHIQKPIGKNNTAFLRSKIFTMFVTLYCWTIYVPVISTPKLHVLLFQVMFILSFRVHLGFPRGLWPLKFVTQFSIWFYSIWRAPDVSSPSYSP